MPRSTTTRVAPPEPTSADLDNVVKGLERTWTATLTVRRQAPDDIGYREIYVSLDGESIGMLRHGQSVTREIQPGPHELRAHNTLFRRALPVHGGRGRPRALPRGQQVRLGHLFAAGAPGRVPGRRSDLSDPDARARRARGGHA